MNPEYKRLHKLSSHHRAAILDSERCGCFYCLSLFAPSEITDWCDNDQDGVGQTALCPHCGIDAVLGSASVESLARELLQAMKAAWF